MSDTFDTLGLSPESLEAVRRARFERPTPIQSQAIPPALAGRDVIGCAATGTGKTAAYVLPLVERFAGRKGTLGLVLAPTRELVQQIAGPVDFFGTSRGVTHAVVIGGEDMAAQAEALKRRPTLVLATPGRLVDLLESRTAAFPQLEALVLDEADRMLDMGFQPQLEAILAALPRRRQTLLFSATLGPDVSRFAREELNRPVRVEVTRSGTPAERAEQRLYVVKPEEKSALLLTLLARDEATALIFTRIEGAGGQGAQGAGAGGVPERGAARGPDAEPAHARRWRASARARTGAWWPRTSPRAGWTSRTWGTSSTTTCRTRRRTTCTASAARRAPRRAAWPRRSSRRRTG